MMLPKWRFALLTAVAALVGCSNSRDDEKSPAEAVDKRPIILVAASAKDAVQDAAAKFKEIEKADITVSAGPSQALAIQITSGGEAHLFLSANAQWAGIVGMANLSLKQRNLLTNDLALVVPIANAAGIEKPEDLLTKAKKVALAGDKVPAGIYGGQALNALKLLAELEAQKKIVRGNDVRSTLAFVERGEADAGIVYSTDALISKQVKTVFTFDPKTYDKIVYPLVLLKAAEGNATASKFYDFLASPEAAEIFKKRGFVVLPGK